jgi:hypothetical protein
MGGRFGGKGRMGAAAPEASPEGGAEGA